MPRFVFDSVVDVAPELLFAWHEQRGAFFRLVPPWLNANVLRYDGLRTGSQAVARIPVGPGAVTWATEIREVDRGRSFADEQVRGPFRQWRHVHSIRSNRDGSSQLTDEVEVAYPLILERSGALRRRFERELKAAFAYRHQTTRNDLARIRAYTYMQPLRVAVSGSAGLVGSALCDFLDAAGHEVYRLVRHRPRTEREIHFDHATETVDLAAMERLDAIVHLAGESMAALRWSEEKRMRIHASRVRSTAFLARSLTRLEHRPSALLNASIVGIYGDRPGEILDESAAPGEHGFLCALGRDWEDATLPAQDAGIRTVQLRFGLVVSPANEIIRMVLEPLRIGLGARIRSRNTDLSWISVDDALYAIYHILSTPSVGGPVNVVSSSPSTRRTFIEAMARTVSTRIRIAVPAATVRFLMGDVAEEVIFRNQRATPKRLLDSGFKFSFPGLEAALQHQFGHARPPTTRESRNRVLPASR